MKIYNLQYRVGTIKYLVNYHDGEKTHKDGSRFFDIATFKNKIKLNAFVKKLTEQGFVYGF